MNNNTVKKPTTQLENIIIRYLENISLNNGYDFLHEKEEEQPLIGQIVFRDTDGAILATLLSLKLFVNEEDERGKFIFYHQKGEFKQMEFSIFEQDSLVNILNFIQNRLNN